MDLMTFVMIVLRGWWLIVLAVVTTAGSAAFVVSRQAPLYGASATVLLKPSPNLEPNQYINAINALSRHETIKSLARIAEGSSMQERVAAALKTAPAVIAASNVTAEVLPDTNLIAVHAESTDPQLAAAIANGVAAELRKEIPDRALLLDITDRAVAPEVPSEPRPARTITLGVLFGLALGVVFALLGWLMQSYLTTRRGQVEREEQGARVYGVDGLDGEVGSAATQPLYTTRT